MILHFILTVILWHKFIMLLSKTGSENLDSLWTNCLRSHSYLVGSWDLNPEAPDSKVHISATVKNRKGLKPVLPEVLYLQISHTVAYSYISPNHLFPQSVVILVSWWRESAWIDSGFLPPGPVLRNSRSHFSNVRCQEGRRQVGRAGSHPFLVHMALRCGKLSLVPQFSLLYS